MARLSMLQRGQRIARRLFQIGARMKLRSSRRQPGECRRLQHVEMIVAQIVGVVAAPFQRIGCVGQRRHAATISTTAWASMRKLLMLAQHVEVIDRVAEMIGIGIELGARIGA